MPRKLVKKSQQTQPKKRKINSIAKRAIDNEIQQTIDYLFATICDKKKQQINFDTLLKSLVAYDLIKDIDEDDVENMLSIFSDTQTLDREQFQELFKRCNINLKPFLLEN